MTQERCLQATVSELFHKWLHRECITSNANTRFMILVTIPGSPSNPVPWSFKEEALKLMSFLPQQKESLLKSALSGQ